MQKKHGDPFPLVFPGAPTILVTGKTDLAKIIFTAPADSFKASEKNPVAPLLGTEGLIMQSGQIHLGNRRGFIPYFSKTSLLPFAEEIKNIFLSISENYKNSGNIIIQEFSQMATLRIIIKFLFPHLNMSEIFEAESLTKIFLKSYSASFLLVPNWVPGTWKNFTQKKHELDNRFYDYFISGLSSGLDSPLNILEGLQAPCILDHIRTFIVAGHETSATSLTWALYFIHKDKYLKNRLQEELNIFKNQSDDEYLELLLSNKFLDSLVMETLRIKPPVPFVTRKIVNRNFNFGDKLLRIDDEIGVCISLLHQQSDVWDNPSEFNPERFLNFKYNAFEFAPFGGGIRKCIGSELAVLEIKILVGFFIKHFQSQLLDISAPNSEVLQITIGPLRPISVFYNKYPVQN